MKYVVLLSVNLLLFFFMQQSAVRHIIVLWKILLFSLFLVLLPKMVLAQVKQDTVYYYNSRNIQSITKIDGKRKLVTTYYTSGNKKSNEEYLDGKLDGEQIRWSESGLKESSVHYRENYLAGKNERWYPSGLLQYSKNYKVVKDSLGRYHSDFEGDYKEWYSTGQLQTSGAYVNNKKEAAWQEWYDNGAKKSRSNYKQGLRYGKVENWYKSGRISIINNYKISWDTIKRQYVEQQDGNYKYYAENGRLLAKWKNKNGKKDGRFREWYENGTPKSDCEYKDGLIFGHKMTWFDNGSLEKDFYDYAVMSKRGGYMDRFENGYREYYKNGKLKTEGQYKLGKKEGEWKTYYENGSTSTSNFYIKGIETGLVQKWYPNTNIMQTEHYMLKELKKDSAISFKQGLYEHYYENGVIEERGMYKNGFKDSMWQTFFKNGAPGNTTLFRRGNMAGVVEARYENGQLKFKSSFGDDPDSSGIKLHGMQYSFYQNGGLEKSYYLYYGMQSRVQRTCYFNGALKSYTLILIGEKELYNSGGNRLNFTFFENGQLRTVNFTTDNRNFGPVVNFFMNGKIGSIENGNPYISNHTTAVWFPDGKYKSGEIITPENKDKLPLSEKEALKILDQFKHVQDPFKLPDSNFTGVWRFPAQGELVLFEAKFRNGALDGEFKSYYNNGKAAVIMHLKDGIADGPFVEYFDNGNAYHKGTYTKGKTTGVWENFDKKGLKAKEFAFDNLGKKKIWEKDWYEGSSQMEYYNDYENNNNSKSWYRNGQLTSEKTILDSSSKHYRVTQYFENGKKRSEEEYLQGKKHGTFIYYYEKGGIDYESHYVNNQQNGPFFKYFKNGKVMTKGQLSMGLKEGKWQNYDSTGKVKETYYDKGIEKMNPSPLYCACSGILEKDLAFAPLLNNLTDLQTVKKWSFNYHAPIDNLYNDLFYSNLQFSSNGEAGFYSMDILAYRELWVRIPDNRGFKLILNYCGAGKRLTKNHLSANINTKDKSQTYITMEGGRFALEFSPQLLIQEVPEEKRAVNVPNENPKVLTDELKPIEIYKAPTEIINWDGPASDQNGNGSKGKVGKQRLEYQMPADVESPVNRKSSNQTKDQYDDVISDNGNYGNGGKGFYNTPGVKNGIPAVYSFNCKELEYNEKDGIKLNGITDPCFPPSEITGTGISITFKSASVDLNAFRAFDNEHYANNSQTDSLYNLLIGKVDFSASKQFTGLIVDSAQLLIPLNNTDKKNRVIAKAYKMHISNLELNGLLIINAEKDKDVYWLKANGQKFTITENELVKKFRNMGCYDISMTYIPGKKELALYFHIKH